MKAIIIDCELKSSATIATIIIATIANANITSKFISLYFLS